MGQACDASQYTRSRRHVKKWGDHIRADATSRSGAVPALCVASLRACRHCRPLALPALMWHPPWESHAGTKRCGSHADAKARHRGTWCNDRAGHQRCTIRAWWYERHRGPWFVITMRALDRAARPAHDRGGAPHRDHAPSGCSAPAGLRVCQHRHPALLPPSCAPIPSRLRHRLESISMCVL